MSRLINYFDEELRSLFREYPELLERMQLRLSPADFKIFLDWVSKPLEVIL